jgi:hypothetical protein
MKRLALATLLLLTSVLMMPSLAAAQGQGGGTQTPSLSIPIVGSGPGGTFAGTFQLQRFVADQGGVVASGVVTGILTAADGTVTSVVQNVTTAVTVGTSSCQILHLDLGPLNLNLLGLQVNLSRIVLDITAQSGPGNLLGNLLCSVANLLNNPSGLANLLNNILGILR